MRCRGGARGNCSICSRMVFFSEQPLSAVTPPNNLEALKSLIAHDTEDAGPALSPSTGADDAKPSGRTTPAGPSSDDPDVLRPLEHDLVIWLGDLNYRLDLTREEILAAAKATEWEKLHASDQLRYGVLFCYFCPSGVHTRPRWFHYPPPMPKR